MSLQDDVKQKDTMLWKKNDQAMKLDEDIVSLNKQLKEKQVNILHW